MLKYRNSSCLLAIEDKYEREVGEILQIEIEKILCNLCTRTLSYPDSDTTLASHHYSHKHERQHLNILVLPCTVIDPVRTMAAAPTRRMSQIGMPKGFMFLKATAT